MKRIFALIAVISVFLGAMAQRPLVTLSHEGELSFFSNLSALDDALNAAVNGDIIYLSEGKFTSSSSTITINKLVSIIGCGYKSHILADLSVSMPNPEDKLDLTLFDGVRLQKVNFSGTCPNNINATISKTWIRNLIDGGDAGGNNLYTKCLIEKASFNGANTHDTYIENSKIGVIDSSNGNSIQVINCNIGEAYYCPLTVISSIIQEGSASGNKLLGANSTTHAIYNSWLPKSILGSSNIITYDCYFDVPEDGILLDDDLEATVDLQEKGYLGEDGTVVGVYGGEFPYSVYPSVPTVDSANSSVEYDADNNKLNVTITVSPN
ncbi:MAG: hypothetical protein HDR88_17970 [Bacteroides sp.]|nr:hypothetical protein [Bacteroides sp.]